MREVSVVYQNGMMGMVDPQVLQGLIESGDIVKFQRTDGWVYPGIDPVRCLVGSGYQGVERRFV